MKKRVFLLITAFVMAITMIGCTATEGQKESQQPTETEPSETEPAKADIEDKETYTIEGIYYQNEEMNRTLYAKLVVPKNMTESEKRPMVIYVHGGTSDWRALLPVAEYMADKGYIGLSLELAGGMPAFTQPAPKSEGADLYPSHYTSRRSDVEAALNYVKSLDIVDTDKIFMYGQSYGGMITMFTAANHNELRGIILESSGQKDGHTTLEGYNGYLEAYEPEGDLDEYIKQYEGDVLIICAVGDELDYYEVGQRTAEIYNTRETGTAEFVSIADGRHSFGMFSEEGQKTTLESVNEFLDVLCDE